MAPVTIDVGTMMFTEVAKANYRSFNNFHLVSTKVDQRHLLPVR